MAEDDEKKEYIFELSQDVSRFDPVSQVVNVFFDDTNKQVFAVRSGGVMGVVVEGPTPQLSTNFRMDDKGPVISIKFSPDQRVLAVQRTKSSVEFMNFSGEIDSMEYSQSCKGKNNEILGFLWTGINKILFVSKEGAELFQVIPEKKMLKLLRSYSISVNWFVYCPQTCLVLLSSGTLKNQMHPLIVQKVDVNKLPRFDIDLPTAPKPLKLNERDITLGVLYGEASIIVIRHTQTDRRQIADVVVYTLVDNTAKKTHVLHLDLGGRFAVNIVDNLVIVHHQATQKSMMFDIMMNGESDGSGSVTYHRPILGQHPIKPFVLTQPALPSKMLSEPTQMQCELYSPNWVVFQPNIIIDAKLGCLWTLELNIQPLVKAFHDKCILVDFLLRRSNSKPVILQLLQDLLKPIPENNQYLVMISGIFGCINEAYRNSIKAEVQSQLAMPASSGLKILPLKSPTVPVNFPPKVVIDQSDMYTNVFSKLVDVSKNQKEDLCDGQDVGKFEVWVLVEYMCSLTDFHIPVQGYMHELLIHSLVQHKAFYQLHQLLQYHVVSDSKHLACQLLSLENLYPAAYQLALDMLKRLSTASEEIIEVLLSKQHIFPALRFIHASGSVDQVSARKFLEAAKQTDDPAVFLAVYKFFELRNLQQKGTSFTKDEHCDQYVKYYFKILSESAREEKSINERENL